MLYARKGGNMLKREVSGAHILKPQGLFPSVGGYMLKNTESIICFILFAQQFSDRSHGSCMI